MNPTDADVAGSSPGPSDAEVRTLMDRLGVDSGANLIGLLQDIQDAFGYLPPNTLDALSRRMRIPLSRIYGVVSFYAQFYTTPRGRHTVRCCRGTACHVRGAGRIVETVERALGIEEGQTTSDRLFYLETVACLGACALSPVVVIDDRYHGKATPSGIEKALKRIIEAESAPEEVE